MRFTGLRIASERRRQAIRYHEIAHCVCAARLGARPCEIHTDGYNMCGHVLIRDFDALPIRSRLVVLAAGSIAAERVDPTDYGGDGDARMGRELVSKWPNPEAALRQAREQAEKLVDENWPLINRLVAELRDAGGFSGDMLTRLLPAQTQPATRNAVTRTRTGSLSMSKPEPEPGTLSVLKDGRTIGEIVKRDYGGFDAFRRVRDDLKLVGRYRTAAEAARAI
jgi:hypothetical protein